MHTEIRKVSKRIEVYDAGLRPHYAFFFFFFFLRFCLYSEAFECNTTSDWLNHMVLEVMLLSNLQILEEKDKESSKEKLVITDRRSV